MHLLSHLFLHCKFRSSMGCVLLYLFMFSGFKPNQYIEDIQMLLLNMSFISRVKRTLFKFHEWRSHE